MKDVAGASDEEVATMRSDPDFWARAVATAPTLPGEVRTDMAYRFEPRRFAEVRVPVQLLSGSESPPLFREAIDVVHAAIPGSRIDVLGGQSRAATMMAPEMVAERAARFLRRGSAAARVDRLLLLLGLLLRVVAAEDFALVFRVEDPLVPLVLDDHAEPSAADPA